MRILSSLLLLVHGNFAPVSELWLMVGLGEVKM